MGRARVALCLVIGALALLAAPTATPDTPAASANAILYNRGSASDDECGSIWSVDPAGGVPTPVVDRGGGDCDPDWSPDGRQFAFASDRGIGTAIYIADSTGANAVQITHPRLGAKDYMPAWSPNGKRISFERYVPGREAYELYVVNTDGTDLRRLAGGHGFDGTPSWSPDGRILFVSDRPHGQRKVCESCAALYVLRIGAKPRRITANRYNALMPSWSRDGKYIAWVRSGSINDQGALYVMRAKGGGVHQLDATGSSPAWAPDSKTLVFAGDNGLVTSSVDGRTRAALTSDGGDSPSWRPTSP